MELYLHPEDDMLSPTPGGSVVFVSIISALCDNITGGTGATERSFRGSPTWKPWIELSSRAQGEADVEMREGRGDVMDGY